MNSQINSTAVSSGVEDMTKQNGAIRPQQQTVSTQYRVQVTLSQEYNIILQMAMHETCLPHSSKKNQPALIMAEHDRPVFDLDNTQHLN